MRALFLFLIGILLVLLGLEVVCRILPVSTATRTGYYIHPQILTYPPNHCFTNSMGWDLRNAQSHCANNVGFPADRDFSYNPQAIALIGDSFVEANYLPIRLRLAAQLEIKLADKPVYAMGGPGSSLLDYAMRARYAASNFGIKTFIFVLTRADVREALCGSGNIHGPCIDSLTLEPKLDLQQPPGLLKRLARESAAAQYIFSQLKFNLSGVLASLRGSDSSSKTVTARTLPPEMATMRVVQEFFEQMSTINEAKYYFVIDPDRVNFYDPKINTPELEQFRKAALINGAIEVDPTPAFQHFVSTSGLVLEIGPYDKHWNAEAVRLVADSIAQRMLTRAAER